MYKSESKNLKQPFSHLSEAQKWIESVEKFGEKYDLIRMENACAMLDNPQNSFKSVHIGGTNGKGSTLQYLNQILIESGYEVGTFTSPYIVHFNERITISNAMISDEDLLHYINVIYQLQDDYKRQYNDQITFFELVTLISFLYFEAKQPDIVLYEVGLGGSLDATNVITPLLAIITSIGYDHMGVLGNTLESIAKNKLGIVKENIPLVTGITQETLFSLFNLYTNKLGGTVTFTHNIRPDAVVYEHPTSFQLNNTQYTLNMPGEHQIRNAIVALEAARVLKEHFGFVIETPHKVNGLKKAHMPGRFESFKGVILDGAHNINGLEASLQTLQTYYPETLKTIVFTVMADKDYKPMLDLLDKYADNIVFTQIPILRSEKAKTLYHKSQHPNKVYFEDYQAAYAHVKTLKDHIVLITGSLYFISMIRHHIIANT